MKKIKIKDITPTGTLESFTNIYAETSGNGIVKLSHGHIKRLASNLLPIIESEWENGYINTTGGEVNDPNFLRMKNYIPLPEGVKLLSNDLFGYQIVLRFYDSGKNYIGSVGKNTTGITKDLIGITPQGTAFFRAYVSKGAQAGTSPKDIYLKVSNKSYMCQIKYLSLRC